ncbi:MAG: HdeD family acid-resistance protein [Anaerolineae bacterium]|nr:HdeD family acid-resistance protein [Anaerolineae bacterium]
MKSNFSRLGWMFLLRGILAILFGIVAFLMPGLTVEALVYLFGAYVLVEGLFTLISVFRDNARTQSRLSGVLEGLLNIAVGVFTFLWPGLVAVSLIIVIGVWAIVTGVLEIVNAIRLRKVIENEFWMGLAGVLSVLAGVLLLVQPGTGALALLWVIASYAILFGGMMIGLAFRFFSRSRQEREADDGGNQRGNVTTAPPAAT